jgi:flagellar hook assembly protein FlgD
MSPASPNPFSGSTTIQLLLPRTSPVSLEIYDVAGRRVRTLVSGTLGPGRHTIAWDGLNSAGSEVSQGIYFLRLISGGRRLTGKVVMLK